MSNELAGLTYVNFGGLDAGYQDLKTLHDRLVASLADLESELNKRLALWEGGAEAAYGDEKAVWNKSAADMDNILRAIKETPRIANEAFQAAERDNVRLWSGQ
jgi:early secretory antigenic target protein ESAT-6